MIRFTLRLMILASLMASLAVKAEVRHDEVGPDSSLAARLISRYAAATTQDDLLKLYRLQLFAGRYIDAEATLDRLSALYQSIEPRRVPALVPWQVFARGKVYEAAGDTPPEALRRAFAERVGTLPDRQVAAILPWINVDPGGLQADLARASQSCEGTVLAQCPSADALIVAREAVDAWAYLSPALEPLVNAELARRFSIEHLLIATPDGAQLAALLVRPRASSQARLTSLLNFTIYARDDWSLADAVQMAAHGYAGVVAYTRGKGRGSSPRAVIPYRYDGGDAATVIGWLAKQTWSDGRVGMFSGSYNGFTQWAAAKHHPPALKAIATNATNAPGIDAPMQGGVFQSFIYPWPFYTTTTKALDAETYDDRARWERLQREWYRSGRPYRDLDKIDGTSNPVFDEWLSHPDYDAYWQRLIPFGREFGAIDIPVLVQTGYYDGGMVGALYYLREHYKYRPNADHRLLIGPYHHTAMQTGVLARVNGYDVDKVALLDLQDVRLAWFDHVFRGAPMPDVLSNRINFEVMGANTWRHVATLDDMGLRKQRFYLTGAHDAAAFQLSPVQGEEAPPALIVNLADRSDAGLETRKDTPDIRNALVFKTEKLATPLEVDGLFHAHLETLTNKKDFDLEVSFYEERPDGSYLDLASYLGRASYMKDRTQRHLLRPGRVQVLSFQSQTLTARLLKAGSRLVVVVGVPKNPYTQINYGTGGDVSGESIIDAGEPLRIQWSPRSYFELGMRD